MKNNRLAFLLLICCFSAFFKGYSQTDTTKVVILSLNDQHARIDNYARLKSLIDSIRSTNKYVLLFAAGDNFTGNPVVDQYKDRGYPMIDLMNMVGFNASAIGNHEFDYGQATLNKRIAQAQFPFLSANIKDEVTGKNNFKPYTIIELDNGIKIGIISAIQLGTRGLPDSHPNNLKGLTFTNGIDELKTYSGLRDSCQIFIALTHLGFEEDLELAKAMPTLDLILGGHTHTLTKPARISNNIPVMQAGSGVRSLAMANIYLVGNKVVKTEPKMLNISLHKGADPEILKALALFNDNKELNRVIGTTIHGISGSDELGSLMTDAVVSLDEIDIAFQNNGGIRIDNIPAGPITVKDIYKLDPFGNEIILFELTGREIKSLISNSYQRAENSIDLQVSGIVYTISTTADKKIRDIEVKLSSGKKLKDSKRYKVGMNSYIASSYKFDHKDNGRSLYRTTADVLIQYTTDKKIVDYKDTKRTFTK